MKDVGAARRLAVGGALLCLLVAGLAAASGHGAGWLMVLAAVAAGALLLPAAAALLLTSPPAKPRAIRERPPVDVPWYMLGIAALLAALAWALMNLHLAKPKPLLPPREAALQQPLAPKPQHAAAGGPSWGPWVALALGMVVLAVLVVVGVQRWRTARRTLVAETVSQSPDPLALAVEAALLDLENEEDARRAVIKAYASAEAVLREHGLPRRPAEAPLEYLDRVLRDLGARAGAVDRLTELFEHAAFSTHDVDTGMRAEAVAVFHGLQETFAEQAAP